MAKIDIVVGGRFHADRMAVALIHSGHDVRVITPFPKNRFPTLAKNVVKSHVCPEIFYRCVRSFGLEEYADEKKMAWFGRLASQSVRKDTDFLIGWSSFALESFKISKAKKILVRDSAHIELQMQILREEYKKNGANFIEKKEAVKRELEEYRLCDRLLLLSEFAKDSFLEKGFPKEKLAKITLGADLSLFKADNHPTKLPLKVIYFGTLSLQKGVQYLIDAFKKIPKSHATLELVGSAEKEFKSVVHHAPMKHEKLSEYIRTFDVFVFPTLHDGFGQTLLQAMSSGLVPIVTENCGASEIITKGKNGVVIPIRDSESIYEAVMRLSQDLELFNSIKNEVTSGALQYSWENYNRQINELFS